ncbi:MAG: L,D-transpeptidase family protein [Phycisphaerae bacterium]|nr:L,D-transpeptidase family protein [Phycisphaerae bacterium]
MTLSSQTPRSSNWKTSERPGDRKGLYVGIGLTAVVVIGIVLIWRVSGPSKANAGSDAPKADPLVTAPGTGTPGSGNGSKKALGEPKATPTNPPKPPTELARGTDSATPKTATPEEATRLALGNDSAKSGVSPPSTTGTSGSAGGDQSSPSGLGPTGELTPGGVPAPAPPQPPKAVNDLAEAGAKLMREGRLVEARSALNRALQDARTPDADRKALRAQLGDLSQSLVFSKLVAKGDPICEEYAVQGGDSLIKIAQRRGLLVDWRLLERVNQMSDPGALRVGQKIKLVRGPFHAVVSKSAFRLDLYWGEPLPPGAEGTSARPDGPEDGWTYVRSFDVGLGEKGGTPTGVFVVRPNSKLVNPRWVNPRTGEKFAADDPKNPIGEHWIGLEGVDANTKVLSGYGVHGTVDPSSIGQEKSMGCVRLNSDDIALLYELLTDRVSVVKIVK